MSQLELLQNLSHLIDMGNGNNTMAIVQYNLFLIFLKVLTCHLSLGEQKHCGDLWPALAHFSALIQFDFETHSSRNYVPLQLKCKKNIIKLV